MALCVMVKSVCAEKGAWKCLKGIHRAAQCRAGKCSRCPTLAVIEDGIKVLDVAEAIAA